MTPNGWVIAIPFLECKHCGAHLYEFWDNGVIGEYRFKSSLSGCVCEVDDELL